MWFSEKGSLLVTVHLSGGEECPGYGIEFLFVTAQNNVKGMSMKRAQL